MFCRGDAPSPGADNTLLYALRPASGKKGSEKIRAHSQFLSVADLSCCWAQIRSWLDTTTIPPHPERVRGLPIEVALAAGSRD